ncbi:hypothetical protein F4604DRAFT_1927007 [Suillus subluteus]|nr:hypothetical protein F4604DRAFT_1927007 [Suillus subluteus]
MPRPAMCPGNVNKHPGQIVLEASAEKLAKATALENAQKKVAVMEDAMAVKQMAQHAGPGHLVRPKPKPCPVTKAVPTANPDKMSVEAKMVSQSTDALKTKYPGLKLTFKDGVNASRKVSNNGTSSTMGFEQAISTEEVEVGKWARSVASKSQWKTSAPPSARPSVIASRDAAIFKDKNLPEDHDKSITVSWGGQQREMEEDQDADKHILDKDEDVDMMDQQGDIEVCEVSNSRLTSSMSVSVMDTTMNSPKSKYIKTKNGCVQHTILNLKKEKPKNSHLPSAAQNISFHSIFIPMVMHWVGNNSYPWTIPDEKLSDVLEDIFMAVCKQPGAFRNDDGCNLAFNLVCQRISEWRGNFGSTAITILMAFFASMDKYKTKEACKEYAEYQLEDSRFVYEDPDNKDSPGAFLLEFILHIFAVQLNATQGCQITDSLNFGLPAYPMALALTTAAAKRALILARDDLIVEDTSDHRKHKIALTLNHSTNKMSNTGTAFSAGNWETDTLVYMEQIEELPFDCIKEIVEQAQLYMKHVCHKGQDEESSILDSQSQPPVPVNPRMCICI